MTIVATIIVLGVLIFVHELGHFLAARSVGVRVERFSIGLGPRVLGFTRGETEYVLSAVPLGGYVKLGGMNDEVMEKIEGGKEDREKSVAVEPGAEGPEASGLRSSGDFDDKPVWARAWVISAGVLMNMAFAFLAYTVVAAGWGNPEMGTTRLGAVHADVLPSAAQELADIPAGATLLQIGEHELVHWGDVRQAILEAPEGPVTFTFTDPEGSVTVPLPEGERVRTFRALEFWAEPVVQAVSPGTPADQAGFQSGDRIVAVNGNLIATWPEFVRIVQQRPESEILVTLERSGGELMRPVTPNAVQDLDPATGEPRTIGQIGVMPILPSVAYSPLAPVEAVQAGWDETYYITALILGFLRDLVTGQISPRNLGSIVAIGEASGQAAAEGLPVFLRFMALFSINLAILNLLPIPVLDGGHLLFLGIEAVRGRPLSVEQRLRWSQVGFVVLIGIMALALGNDFLRLFGL